MQIIIFASVYSLSTMHALSILLVGIFTFVELNCENLFDCAHDSLKQDEEFLPESLRHWNKSRYWEKLKHTGQTILSCGDKPDNCPLKADGWTLPDMVALCEVENDSVMRDLTKRSVLRNAGYEYLVTQSPDLRGIDVALLYRPDAFQLLHSHSLRITPLKGMRPTRDILYAEGLIANGDTLHVFVVHLPSRYGGTRHTRPYRLQVGKKLMESVDSIRTNHPQASILVAGDFNEGDRTEVLQWLNEQGLHSVTAEACGQHGARGTYKYQGIWESIDHVLTTAPMRKRLIDSHVNDALFLLEEDQRFGKVQPRRNYQGYRYNDGFSDHLPLVVHFNLEVSE